MKIYSRKDAEPQRGFNVPQSLFASLRLCVSILLTRIAGELPFAKPGAEPAYAAQMKALFKRHPKTTFIWAHIGVGRITSEQVRKQNYERIFDKARRKVRSWEATHLKSQSSRMTN